MQRSRGEVKLDMIGNRLVDDDVKVKGDDVEEQKAELNDDGIWCGTRKSNGLPDAVKEPI